MDPFEARMQFLTMLRRLNASQQSIQKVVSFAMKYFTVAGEDMWEVIVDECQRGNINGRINILYFLDTLCETCYLVKSHANSVGVPSSSGALGGTQYVDFLSRDLGKLVESVVPQSREGLINYNSAKQILDGWRTRRLVDPQIVDAAMSSLQSRSAVAPAETDTKPAPTGPPKRGSRTLARAEIFKRIEEDRERHKRLRERRWVQPVSFDVLPALTSLLPLTDDADGERELPLDVEFENAWETTSDWNEDDEEAMREENELCFPPAVPTTAGEDAMDMDMD
ncbi:CTD kinase subunit gamma CTK3-domain-containing protein [Schizophyllum amplum]|uniref:CTD kinase subunit gamma CTK3-domain-containing protein n=1 Tax=Schizophyllum amplum TaxID=97359 RepID=A0A550CS00_9AGAR|nr:CTD kinase subunit gamma CTK3-domain-containing protein [Auriculariopsis ampla]